jgi:serine/threonine protein phosphatase 1
MNERFFVIGDVHGCAATLRALLEELDLVVGDQICFLGDYIDRGPDSKGVIDTILGLKRGGYTVHALRGNHEQLLLDSVKGFSERDLWLRNGGLTTLESFGVEDYGALLPRYRYFFEDTQHYLKLPGHVLVHAGLNFETNDPFEDTYSMLWIRNYKADPAKIGGRMVVHGHTPTPLKQLMANAGRDGTINLDAGCVYKGMSGMGYLLALELNSNELSYHACIDGK